jgi:hypothetical protein
MLAVSGGMRLDPYSSLLTTCFALVAFVHGAHLFQLNLAVTLFASFTIGAAGLLAHWMTDIVRRQMRNGSGRALMERFLPKSVVVRAFETPLELLQRPRLCQVTVMVTDLRGFTHFSETRQPVEVLHFLNQFQGFLAGLVQEHGAGWISLWGMGCWQFLGHRNP